MADPLNKLIGIIVVICFSGLFILAAALQVRNARLKLKAEELSKWSRNYSAYKLIASSLVILFYLVGDILLIINILRWK